MITKRLLVGTEVSRAIDSLAVKEWGFEEAGLVEAAGRGCAVLFSEEFPRFFKNEAGRERIVVAAGGGNNGADALVMLRYWLLSGLVLPSSAAVIVSRSVAGAGRSLSASILGSLCKMKVEVVEWDGAIGSAAGHAVAVLSKADLIVDGIAGTGVSGPLAGIPGEMALTLSAIRETSLQMKAKKAPFIVSVDIPSGNFEGWKASMPIVRADVTLAIEPQKSCVYNPAARVFAGRIIPVGSVFPPGFIAEYSGKEKGREAVELLDWEAARGLVPPVKPTAYKHERGVVEIHAGAAGTSGAAVIAARGAQAAGAGLIRLVVDDDIYPALSSGLVSSFPGIMVSPVSSGCGREGFYPDAVLLGPGWGKAESRKAVFEEALEREKKGAALVLDADALAFAKDRSFHNRAILTPHPGEFALLTGASMEEVLSDPIPLLLKTAKEKKAVIILKGHVINVADSLGRRGVIDGMVPSLAAGGSGDLLAGICAAVVARAKRLSMVKGAPAFDAYACACAASSLLIAAGKATCIGFTDPLETAAAASRLAGRAWLEETDKTENADDR